VVDDDGSQLGVMTPFDAIQRAQERGLDLVEVAPNANPPVCRIMDYGKYKYELKKKAAVSKAKAHAAILKEVKLRPRTDEHDLDFKVKNARRFLIEGDKVKVTLMFRGRELDHKEMGYKILDRLTKDLVHVGTVDRKPEFEGRLMIMYMSPLPAKVQPKAHARPVATAASPSEAKEVSHAEIEDQPSGEETVS